MCARVRLPAGGLWGHDWILRALTAIHSGGDALSALPFLLSLCPEVVSGSAPPHGSHDALPCLR